MSAADLFIVRSSVDTDTIPPTAGTGLTSRVVALEKAGEVVGQQLTGRLERVQHIIDTELEAAVAQARQPGAARAGLADVILAA